MAATTGVAKRRGRPSKASQSDSKASPATMVADESQSATQGDSKASPATKVAEPSLSASQGCTECLTAVYDQPMETARAIHNWLSSLSRGVPHAQR